MEKLLFEIGTEEIPAKFMPGILKQLQELAADKMQELVFRLKISSLWHASPDDLYC